MDEIGAEPKGGLLAQAQHYWHVILRWKWTVVLFFFAAVSAATVFSFLAAPVFTAKGSVWIEDNSKILPFEDVQSFDAGPNLKSHARLLQSRTLAAETIEKLKLYENPNFAGKPDKKGPPRDPSDPIFREMLVQQFLANVTVSSIERESRLVDVQYTSRNPGLASEILNALFDCYVDLIVRKRLSNSKQAAEFLDSQIAELQTEIEAKEKELSQYGSEKDILPLTAAETQAISGIAEVSKALTDATIDKINKLNIWSQLKAAPLGEIPNAPDGSLIQRLREQYVTLNRQYAARLDKVRPEWPEMQRQKSELDSATEALKNETQNLIRTAYNDYQAAVNKELSLKRLLDNEKIEAYKAKGNAVLYNSLRIDLDNRQALLEALSKRRNETQVSAQLKEIDALTVWIVDRADLPLGPTSPNKKKNVAMGFLIGLVGGIGLALGIEYLNHSVKTSKDILSATGLPTIGAIPAFETKFFAKGPLGEWQRLVRLLRGQRASDERGKARRRKNQTSEWLAGQGLRKGVGVKPEIDSLDLIVSRDPASIQTESFRSIRTTLLVSSPPGRIKALIITSPLAQEGKSSIVSNLGIIMTQAGKQVIIIDADLRKPRQSEIFRLGRAGREAGLSTFLSSSITETEIIKLSDFPGLSIIPSGPIPANPVELLVSDRMDMLMASLKRRYDYVLLDAPPILAVSDALALGPMGDGLILIARAGETPLPALKQAKQKLDTHRLKCLGVILNGVDLIEQDGYYSKQYYHYYKPHKPE